uniref:Uncharacterized protein n=1 Tax=Cacopsylla melanoneura TaxID=428564 RepID=A0A8D9EYX8_9HEMI
MLLELQRRQYLWLLKIQITSISLLKLPLKSQNLLKSHLRNLERRTSNKKQLTSSMKKENQFKVLVRMFQPQEFDLKSFLLTKIEKYWRGKIKNTVFRAKIR